MQPLALGRRVEMGGDKTNRRKALFVVGGDLQGEPTTKEPVRSVGLAGREEAKPLGLPDKKGKWR